MIKMKNQTFIHDSRLPWVNKGLCWRPKAEAAPPPRMQLCEDVEESGYHAHMLALTAFCCMKSSHGHAEFPDDGNLESPPKEESQREVHKNWADMTHCIPASRCLPTSCHTVNHHVMTGRASEKCVTWQFHHWDKTMYLEKSSWPFCVIKIHGKRDKWDSCWFSTAISFEANYFWAEGGHANGKTQCNKYMNQ